MNIEGALYFPENFLELGGTGDGYGNQIIAGSFWIHGNGTIGVAYDGRYNNTTLKVFLVE